MARMTRYAVRLQKQIDALNCVSFGIKTEEQIDEAEKALDKIEELLGPDNPVEKNIKLIRDTINKVNSKPETKLMEEEVCKMVETLGLDSLSEEWKYNS